MSQTEVFELQKNDNYAGATKSTPAITHRVSHQSSLRRSGDQVEDGNASDLAPSLPAPEEAEEELQSWNQPRVNIFRTFAAFWALFVMGMNDAAYGVTLPNPTTRVQS